MFLVKSNKMHLTSLKKFYNSSTRIPLSYIGHEIHIYNGKTLRPVMINKYNLGLRAGTLTWFKKPASIKRNLKKK